MLKAELEVVIKIEEEQQMPLAKCTSTRCRRLTLQRKWA